MLEASLGHRVRPCLNNRKQKPWKTWGVGAAALTVWSSACLSPWSPWVGPWIYFLCFVFMSTLMRVECIWRSDRLGSLGVGFVPYGTHGWHLGHHAWWPEPLCSEPSHWPRVYSCCC